MEKVNILDIVDRSWVFDRQTYPHLPENNDARLIFKLKHILLHIQKHQRSLRYVPEERMFNSIVVIVSEPTTKALIELRPKLLKMLVSLLKLEAVLEINYYYFESKEERELKGVKRESKTFFNIFFTLSNDLSHIIENADHHGSLNMLEARKIVTQASHDLFYLFDEKDIPIPWEYVTSVLKSKV